MDATNTPASATVSAPEPSQATPDSSSPPADAGHDARTSEQEPFRRGLGAYPLRSRPSPALLLRRPTRKPHWGRNTGCAFAVSHASTDPRTRKQAMAEDHIGWSAAERAEIANHVSNQSWTYIDRSEVPAG
eukprot:3826318-Pleurochrysis_carterae.AAC.1